MTNPEFTHAKSQMSVLQDFPTILQWQHNINKSLQVRQRIHALAILEEEKTVSAVGKEETVIVKAGAERYSKRHKTRAQAVRTEQLRRRILWDRGWKAKRTLPLNFDFR